MSAPSFDGSRVRLPRREHARTTRVVDAWHRSGLVDDALAACLSDSLVPMVFDWRRLARYAFLVATLCVAIAACAVLADKALVALLMRLFDAPAIAKAAALAMLAAFTFHAGVRARRRRPERVLGNEAVFLLGVLALAASIWFLGVAVDDGSGHFSRLLLLATILYAAIGLAIESPLVWVFALLSLGSWMGTETWYASGRGAYFLGMNQPLRFVLFGASLALLGLAHKDAAHPPDGQARGARSRLLSLSAQTTVVGLLYLFVALWLLSIFGNDGDRAHWARVPQSELFGWSILFGAVAAGAIAWGLRRDDAVLRGFGLTFLFINLYTRFFEYGWESLHKAVFFTVLGASFWLIGRHAEAMWTSPAAEVPDVNRRSS